MRLYLHSQAWKHEVFRVYSDKLNCDEDKALFAESFIACCNNVLNPPPGSCMSWNVRRAELHVSILLVPPRDFLGVWLRLCSRGHWCTDCPAGVAGVGQDNVADVARVSRCWPRPWSW